MMLIWLVAICRNRISNSSSVKQKDFFYNEYSKGFFYNGKYKIIIVVLYILIRMHFPRKRAFIPRGGGHGGGGALPGKQCTDA